MADELPRFLTPYDIEEPPGPVPAHSSRSPKRKPRHRRAFRAWDLRQAKQLWLATYRLTGDPETACKRVRRSLETVRCWLRRDEDFKAQFEAICADWKKPLPRPAPK